VPGKLGQSSKRRRASPRSLAETDNHQALALCEALIRQAPFFVGIADADFRPIFLNAAGRQMVGLAPDADISAILIPEFFHPDDQGIIRDVALPALARDGAWEGELRFRHFGGGADMEVKWRAFTCCGPDGTIIGAATMTTDISARKQAEVRLKKSEARLKAAVDLVGLSPYGWNPLTGVLDWDARLKAMWGLPPDAQIDQARAFAVLHPEDLPKIEAAVGRWLDPQGGVDRLEYRVNGFDGVERWVATHGQTIFDDGGQPADFIGVALDITERKRAEADLRESEARFRQFAEYSADVLWILDIETMRHEYLSPAFERVWGEQPCAMFADAARWRESVHPEDRERAAAWVERARAGEVAVIEYRIVRPDGAVRWIRDTVFPIRDEQGRVRRIGGVAQELMNHGGSTVYLVDADEGSRTRLSLVLHGQGHTVKTFASARAFLEVAPVLVPGCVLLDTRGPEMENLAVPREIKERRVRLPTIVIGDAGGDVRFGAQVIKAGAVDFLPIPYEDHQLVTAVATALADLRTDAEEERAFDIIKVRISEMSRREQEILDGLMGGKTNKQIARSIGISPRTVEVHRAHLMERLGAQTLSELLIKATAAGLRPPPSA
jgi:PAS domain S-box-containing protein